MRADSRHGREVSATPPTPRVLYIHDDLSESVRREYGPASEAFHLTEELLRLFRQDVGGVEVLTLKHQEDLLIARGDHSPFAMTVGIGRAGERVAEHLHRRTGWFPSRRRVDVAREESDRGAYNVVSLSDVPLGGQLHGLEDVETLAVVDDTVFSGLTMRTVLGALPKGLMDRTHAFCLRSVAESLDGIRALCRVSAGFAAPGSLLEEVSFINLSGLVLAVGIRRAGGPPLAFFQRESWMRAWFQDQAGEVVELSRRLDALLAPERVLG